MSLSEIMTILILFHQSQMKTFKDFYLRIVSIHYRSYFPNLLGYNRFLKWIPRTLLPFTGLFLITRGQCTGFSFIDSMPIKVCHPIRSKRNKVFKGFARSGKSSMGWLFGFKLHVIVNHIGEIVDIYFTSGNVNDRHPLPTLYRNLFGKVFGDKGYLSKKLQSKLRSEYDVELVTKVRKNMKNPEHSVIDKTLLSKRSLIETVIGELKKRTIIQHTRHRSTRNFMVNLFSSLIQYNLFQKKPSLKSVLVL